ncbi:hypothetical protein [Lysobacter claricitrinus]|uniref:hypothetical protein n=1 Tax=Lysobacter claricitrinus TaxID=3367728 RepID=UPI0037DA85DE
MSYLHIERDRLRRFLSPWHHGSGPVVWQPDAADANGEAKQKLIALAADTVAACDLAMKGRAHAIPAFDDSDYTTLEQALIDDYERDRFLALAQACQLALHELRRFDT